MARARRSARKQMDPAHRRAARDAGTWGLALFAGGVNVAWLVVVLLLVLAALRSIVLEIFGTLPGEAGAAVHEWVDGLDLTLLAWLVVVALLIAVGLCWTGVAVSTRILRRAGIEPARRITVRGCLLGTLVQVGLGLVAGWMLGLLWLLAGLLAPWLIIVLSLVLSLTTSTIIGYLAGPVLWRSQVRRIAASGRLPQQPADRAGTHGRAPRGRQLAEDLRLAPGEHHAPAHEEP